MATVFYRLPVALMTHRLQINSRGIVLDLQKRCKDNSVILYPIPANVIILHYYDDICQN